MKVTVLCKKEILLQYPLVIKKLVEMCKDLASIKNIILYNNNCINKL